MDNSTKVEIPETKDLHHFFQNIDLAFKSATNETLQIRQFLETTSSVITDVSALQTKIKELQEQHRLLQYDLNIIAIKLDSTATSITSKEFSIYQSNYIVQDEELHVYSPIVCNEDEDENLTNNSSCPIYVNEKMQLSSWDEKFMKLRLIENPSENDYQQLADLGDYFLTTASTYTKMIVAEQHVEDFHKKITPIDVGGVAGGTKFSIHGLFFKYPVDTCINGIWLYGGPTCNNSFAAKASNHDLTGLAHCMAADVKKQFNFPLSAIIDYQGFRINVMTHLPIDKNTIIYGSGDAGHTMHCRPDISDIMKEIGKNLNLAPHLVSKSQPTEMALCGDVEVHKIDYLGKEINFVLDLARLFPPAVSSSEILRDAPSGAIFFRMLRPEFLQKLQNVLPPLSSDAMSNWQCDPNTNQMNNDVRRATVMLEEHVEKYAKELCNQKMNGKLVDTAYVSAKYPTYNILPVKDLFIQELHMQGLNIRYLGLLLIKMKGKNTIMINFLKSLMITRAIKNMWRNKIRKAKGRLIYEVCLQQTEEFINEILLLGIKEENQNKFWEKIINNVQSMFAKGILNSEEKELLPTMFIGASKQITIYWIIIRFTQMCGIVLCPGTVQHIVEENSFQFSRADIQDFLPVIKCLPILDYFIGLHYLSKARKEYNLAGRLTFYKASSERLANVVNFYPSSVRELCAEATFGAMKLERKIVGDLDDIAKQLFNRWKNTSSQLGSMEYIDCLCSSLWRLFILPVSFDDKFIVNVKLQDTPLTKSIFDCFPVPQAQLDMITTSLATIQKKMLCLSGRLEEFIWKNEIYLPTFPKNIFGIVNHSILKSLLEEAKGWDIDIERKWWFFSQYFSVPELVTFCGNNNIVPNDKFTNQFMLMPAPLLMALFYYCDTSLFAMMTQMGVEDEQLTKILCISNKDGSTVLHNLINKLEGTDYKIPDLIISTKCNLDATNEDGNTALHLALLKSYGTLATNLIKGRCNVDIQNMSKLTPLHIAAKKNKRKYVRLGKSLLEAKCDVEITNIAGETSLHIAVRSGCYNFIKLLLKHGCNVDAVAESEITPLHIACEMGDLQTVKLLCKHHANILACNKDGKNALDLVTKMNTVRSFLEQYIEVNNISLLLSPRSVTLPPDLPQQQIKNSHDYLSEWVIQAEISRNGEYIMPWTSPTGQQHFLLGGVPSDVVQFIKKENGNILWNTPHFEVPIVSLDCNTSSIVGNKLYIFGGTTEKAICVSDVYCVDLLRLRCSKLITTGNKPSPRSFHRAVVLGTKIVVFGGQKTFTKYPKWHNDVHTFDTETCNWVKIETHGTGPPPSAAGSLLLFKETTIVLFGGGYWEQEFPKKKTFCIIMILTH